MKWYYIDGPSRVGPLNETEWAELVRTGKITPETLVWQTGMEKWTPYSQVPPPEEPEVELPDFEEELEAVPEAPEAYAARVVDLDYPVNLGHCISRAWEVYKSCFWILVGAALFIYSVRLTAQTLSILQILFGMALEGVFLGGIYQLYLRLMRGEPCQFVDLLGGFRAELFKPLALQTLVSFLVMMLCFIPVEIATKMLNIFPPNFQTMLAADQQKAATLLYQTLQDTLATNPEKILVWQFVILACSIPAVYFTLCWMFSIPLIVDKKMAFWPAMQLSRRKVLQHPWRIGVFSVVAWILGFSGIVVFGIGVFFTIPLSFLIPLFLYEDMFNRPPQKSPETE